MTPRLATKPTIHDPSITGQDVGTSDGAVAARGPGGRPSRQFGLVEGPDRPSRRRGSERHYAAGCAAADVLTAAAALVLVLTVSRS